MTKKDSPLNENDVHYIMGLIALLTDQQGDIIEEVCLGKMVYDVDGEEERDVDVTVKYSLPDGGTGAMKGIEVKHEGRKLDIIKVEQLCTKLNDMPDISERSIVSTAGYYKPAIRKAKKKGVRLYQLRQSREPPVLPFANFSKDFSMNSDLYCLKDPDFVFLVEDEDDLTLEWDARLLDENEQPTEKTLWDLAGDAYSRGTEAFNAAIQKVLESPGITLPAPVSVTVEYENKPRVMGADGEIFAVPKVKMSGTIAQEVRVLRHEFRELIDVETGEILAACALGLTRDENLMAFGLSQKTGTIKALHVPLKDREKKKKIRNFKLA